MKNQILAFLFACGSAFAAPGFVGNYTNNTCLWGAMYDAFGDGWRGSDLWIEEPNGDAWSFAPKCHSNDTADMIMICPDQDGSYMITLSDNELPPFYWEMTFMFGVANTPNHYTGGFNTSMVWDYDMDTDTWTLLYHENLWPNTKTCGGCGVLQECKPKPNPKPNNKDISGPKKAKDDDDVNDDVNDDVDDDDDDMDIDNATDMTPAPKYGPPAVSVRVTMFDEAGDGWWLDNYSGPSWYISDFYGTHLFQSGTLCDRYNHGRYSGYCQFCLGDGPYVFRVTGRDTSNFTSWDFCGTKGDFADELHFHVYHGKCYPDVLRTSETVCADNLNTTILVSGILSVSGVSSELFSARDASIFVEALGAEIGDKALNVHVLSTTLDAGIVVNRKLSTFTHNINFQLEVVAETFGVDGSNNNFVNNLVTALGDSLDSKIVSGEYMKVLKTVALSSGANDMVSASQVSLVSLSLDGVSYTGAKAMPAGMIFEGAGVTSSDEVESRSYDISTMVVLFASMAFGLAVIGGIVKHRVSGYAKLTTESSHGGSNMEITGIEMDESLRSSRFEGQRSVGISL